MTRPSATALRRHAAACERREAGYIDPDSGLFVLTSHHLREQGECCGNGCRHCPWDPEEQRDAGRPEGAPAYPYP
jgi:hypothetical protein